MKTFFFYTLLVLIDSETFSLSSVLVFPNKRKESTETSYTRFNVEKSPIEDLSFCFWLKVNHLVGAKVLHYDLKDSQGIGFTLQEEYGFLKLKTVDLLFDYISPHVPDKWSHWCVVYDSHEEYVTMYMNGKITFSKKNVTALEGSEFHDELLSHVLVGMPGGDFSQPFNGEFTRFMVWNVLIDQNEVERQMNCEEGESEGLILDWRTVNLERGSTVMMKQMEEECPSKSGTVHEILNGFTERIKFEEAETACQALGGKAKAPENEAEIEKIRNTFTGFKEFCNSKFWVPFRRQEGRWVSSESNSVSPYLPWIPGQPNGGRHQACAEAKFDKTTNSFLGYNDLNCAKSKRCFYCHLPSTRRFSLRGLCRQASVDSNYVASFKVENFETRPLWKGYRSTEIVYSGERKEWMIRDITSEKIIGLYNGSDIWPVGRKNWYLQSGVCEASETVQKLLLSSCLESEFTCGDGTCVPLSSKCDGVSDCKDELDESDCSVVEFPTSIQYKESLPPIKRQSKKILPAEVGVSIDLMSITDIKETSLKWGCKLQLNMTWYDERLRWKDLRENANLNVITRQEGNQAQDQNLSLGQFPPTVWVATVIFSNTPNNDFSLLDSKSSLTVEKKGNITMSTMNQLEEIAYYEGFENPITYSRKYTRDFSCNFHLQTFPFDTQHCSIHLDTPDHLNGLMKLLPEKVTYSGPLEMMQYNVVSWDIKEVDEGLEVKVTLQRRFNHHLATTFIPTFFLMIVCQSTLYFNAEHFKTTSGVAVTTMLVMYTLYQAVSHKLPPTSYIKMIDVWLIFGLILPFCVFFLLVLIDHLPKSRPDELTLSRIPSIRSVLVTIAHFVLPLTILIFTLSYTVTAVLIYNDLV